MGTTRGVGRADWETLVREGRGCSGRGDTGGGRSARWETLGCGKGKGHKSDDACTMPY